MAGCSKFFSVRKIPTHSNLCAGIDHIAQEIYFRIRYKVKFSMNGQDPG